MLLTWWAFRAARNTRSAIFDTDDIRIPLPPMSKYHCKGGLGNFPLLIVQYQTAIFCATCVFLVKTTCQWVRIPNTNRIHVDKATSHARAWARIPSDLGLPTCQPRLSAGVEGTQICLNVLVPNSGGRGVYSRYWFSRDHFRHWWCPATWRGCAHHKSDGPKCFDPSDRQAPDLCSKR